MDYSRFFLIVGNSGSGKDSILMHVKRNWTKKKCRIVVPRRYITRPPSPETEDYHSVSIEEFQEMSREGRFLLEWKSYNLYYGVPKDVLDELEAGNIVIVNVSRQVIEEARKRFPGIRVIFVWVPIETIVKRIKERGRESGEALQARIDRARANENLPGADFIVENTGTIAEAGEKLLRFLEDACDGAR